MKTVSYTHLNRAALPAIFNPEDLNALEQALRLKDCLLYTSTEPRDADYQERNAVEGLYTYPYLISLSSEAGRYTVLLQHCVPRCV